MILTDDLSVMVSLGAYQIRPASFLVGIVPFKVCERFINRWCIYIYILYMTILWLYYDNNIFLSYSIFLAFFPRASEGRVLPIVEVCYTSSYVHIFITFSHLHIFITSSHLLIFSSSHLLIFTFSPSLSLSYHLHMFSSSHLLIFTSSLSLLLSRSLCVKASGVKVSVCKSFCV